MKLWRNWSGLVEARPAGFHRPGSLEALRRVVREATARGHTVRPVGQGHSFTPLCASEQVMVSLERLQGVESVDTAARVATAWAGTRLKELGEALARLGLAMENLGDINHQSIAGAVSTGTHGTGAALGSLSTQVVGLTLVTAEGEVVECSPEQEPELFQAARLSLGALGVVAQVRLRLVPAYRLRLVRRSLSLEECLAHLEQARTRHRHYEFFWFPHSDQVQTKEMDVTEAPARSRSRAWLEELVVENALFLLANETCRLRPELCASVSRLSGRLASKGEAVGPSHTVFATSRLVRFQEMEYAVPVERGAACLRELVEFIRRQQVPVYFPLEYRFVKGDDIPLSPMYGRDSALIAVHQYQGMEWRSYFEGAEAIFRNHGGRPHWGKHHWQTAATLRPLYPRWEHFQQVRERLDPHGRFLNPYLRRLLLG
jgi:FAD-linked oxidoreductase